MLIKSPKFTEICFGKDVYCFDQFDLRKKKQIQIGHQRQNSFGDRIPSLYRDACSLYLEHNYKIVPKGATEDKSHILT